MPKLSTFKKNLLKVDLVFQTIPVVIIGLLGIKAMNDFNFAREFGEYYPNTWWLNFQLLASFVLIAAAFYQFSSQIFFIKKQSEDDKFHKRRVRLLQVSILDFILLFCLQMLNSYLFDSQPSTTRLLDAISPFIDGCSIFLIILGIFIYLTYYLITWFDFIYSSKQEKKLIDNV